VPDHPTRSPKPAVLTAIKVTHRVVWALFVACIVAIPFAAWRGAHGTAAWFAAIVAVEVIVLAARATLVGDKLMLLPWEGRMSDCQERAGDARAAHR
jgi:hypothetical protein